MNSDLPPPAPRSGLLRNWISLSGLVVAVGSVFAFVLLLALDQFAEVHSPYLGILTYLVSPGFMVIGIGLILVGWLIQRRRLNHGLAGAFMARFTIDLSRPGDRRSLGVFSGASAVFLLVTAVGSYQTYHVTKSVTFCGQACHDSMEPEYTAYQHSPHAQVECTACHIAPGAKNFVQAKVGGLHQVYSTWLGHVEAPITGEGKTHIDQKTCEQCHWPKKYVGNLDRTYTHFLDDPTNTPYAVRLLLKVGGGDPTHGPVGGIHWHMNVGNKVEYVATDNLRQKIPWVRLTDANGIVTEFRSPGFTNEPPNTAIRRMDCMDCHNRPAHDFRSPNDAVDMAMALGKISTNLPAIKRAAVLALTKTYASRPEALDQIAAALQAKYPPSSERDSTIVEVKAIYNRYFFPEMKTNFRIHPNNIGHKDSKGCFRCHDDEHVSTDGHRRINAKDCNSCHTILAEGRGAELAQLQAAGKEFKHPEEGWKDLNCYDCHNGSIDDKK